MAVVVVRTQRPTAHLASARRRARSDSSGDNRPPVVRTPAPTFTLEDRPFVSMPTVDTCETIGAA